MEWDGKKRNNSKLQFVTETPLRTTVVVDTESKCEKVIQQIISYVLHNERTLLLTPTNILCFDLFFSDCSERKAV